jgi:hypothetical protein
VKDPILTDAGWLAPQLSIFSPATTLYVVPAVKGGRTTAISMAPLSTGEAAGLGMGEGTVAGARRIGAAEATTRVIGALPEALKTSTLVFTLTFCAFGLG